MLDDIEITEKLKGSLKRIMRRVPKKLRKNNYILETSVAYLKMGGEKLAKQSIEVFKAIDTLEAAQRKRKLRDEALLRIAEARKIKEVIENESHPGSDDGTQHG